MSQIPTSDLEDFLRLEKGKIGATSIPSYTIDMQRINSRERRRIQSIRYPKNSNVLFVRGYVGAAVMTAS
jgi:hypothetical protein